MTSNFQLQLATIFVWVFRPLFSMFSFAPFHTYILFLVWGPTINWSGHKLASNMENHLVITIYKHLFAAFLLLHIVAVIACRLSAMLRCEAKVLAAPEPAFASGPAPPPTAAGSLKLINLA